VREVAIEPGGADDLAVCLKAMRSERSKTADQKLNPEAEPET